MCALYRSNAYVCCVADIIWVFNWFALLAILARMIDRCYLRISIPSSHQIIYIGILVLCRPFGRAVNRKKRLCF